MSQPEAASGLPSGAVTFLLTDVEGSTALWDGGDREVVGAAMRRHLEILSGVVERHGGVRPQEQGEGDSIVAAFARPSDAVAAALDAQIELHAELWPTAEPVRVRMAVHTGEAQLRDAANYAGQAIIRAARLRSLAQGGQVLLSGSSRDLVVDDLGAAVELRSLGEQHLRGLGRPEQVWQLVHPSLPDRFEPLLPGGGSAPPLPISLTPFIGRDDDVRVLAEIVGRERLVTTTGAGGAGKTRIALEVGRRAVDEGVDVWFVELAPLDASAVESAVRAAVGISEAAKAPTAEAVRRRVDGREALLILDNCEHVADQASELVDRLLRHVPTLRVLATSRVMLDLPGEVAWRVPPLGLPVDGDGASVDELERSDAVRLFCDRARRARPNFVLDDDNGTAIGEICRRLDGIPLAIELAAARCRMLAPAQILAGLDDAFRLLTGGSTFLLPRQQTLDASISWSYDLLSDAERTLLRRLSVFVDGWTLDAAESVCADEQLDRFAVFDALDRLVSHSLVRSDDTASTVRFSMLETIRQYGAQRLRQDHVERDAVCDRLATYVTEWAVALEPRLYTSELEVLFPLVTAERGNVLAAADWLFATGSAASVFTLVEAVFPLAGTRAWVPTIARLVDLLDRLGDQVAPMERVFRSLARASREMGRGRITEMLANLADAAVLASQIGDDTRAARSRSMTLLFLGAGGAAILDELLEEAERLAAVPHPYFATYGYSAAERVAAVQGDIALRATIAARLDSLPTSESMSPMQSMLRACSAGVAAYLSASPEEALRLLDPVCSSTFVHSGNLFTAIMGRGLAACDLGDAAPHPLDEVLRREAEVEGNSLYEAAMRAVECARLLRADRVAEAAVAFEGAARSFAASGILAFSVDDAYVLVAAGHAMPRLPSAGPANLIVPGMLRRSMAEEALRDGDSSGALAHAHAALRSDWDAGLERGAVQSLECAARTLAAGGRETEAVRILAACSAFRAERRLLRVPCLERLAASALEQAKDALGHDLFEAALAAGATLSLAEAIEYATRQRVARPGHTVGWAALTPTEARVAELVAEGLTNGEVAKDLLMGPETVKTHLSRVFAKVGVANRKELILAASRRAAARHR